MGEAFDEFVMPFVRDSKGKKLGDVNVVFVSHGIAISETIGAVFKRSVNGRGLNPRTWSGLHNTAWTRLVVGMEVSGFGPCWFPVAHPCLGRIPRLLS